MTMSTAFSAPVCTPPCQNATTAAASTTRLTMSTSGPGRYQAVRSRIGWLGE